MRVCLEFQSAIAQRAGVGRYTHLLASHLAPLMGDDTLNLFYFDFQRKGEPFHLPGAIFKAVRWIPGRIVQKSWKTLGTPPFDWFSGPADVFHFPNFVRPPLRRGRSIVTIHDVSFLRFPETMEPRNYAYLSAHIRKTVRQADAIITDCRFVADELQEMLHVPSERIYPILLGNTPGMTPPTPELVKAFRTRHQLDRPYLLHVGTFEPRKNHAFLFEVFDRLTDFDGDLVLAGGAGWRTEPILERMNASPRRNRIRRLNFIPDQDLPALYAGAELFLFPSLYEGFGFPPLEAMACGTHALASPHGSLREVLEGGATLLDTDHADRWCESILTLLNAPLLLAQKRDTGQKFAERYTWTKTASHTLDLYRQIAP